MTDAERETVEAIFDVTAKALQLLRAVLAATKAGTPLDVEQIDAKACQLAALTWQVEDRLLGLRPDGTDAPPPTTH
jgi:hypothetical protein